MGQNGIALTLIINLKGAYFGIIGIAKVLVIHTGMNRQIWIKSKGRFS